MTEDKPQPEFIDLAPANEVQAAQIRDMAQNSADHLQQIAKNMQESSAAMARWILASLLAMNTAGAAGVLSVADKLSGPVGPSIVAFSIGAGLAVATGVNGLVTGMRLANPIGRAIELMRLSVFESTIHASTRQAIADMNPIATQQVKISGALAAGSLGAFFTGVALAL